jgi:phosphoribosylaminoimidazolecarboxamide formyltransferase / IMP cyclohydrolase
MIKIKNALISVYEKTGLLPLAKGLSRMGVRIYSTGNTAKALKAAGIKCTELSRVTGYPEILDGRVKTLHPRVHAGLLARRDKPSHMALLKKERMPQWDMVVVNLYPFEKILKKGGTHAEIIEMIDIGGPTMLRAAAKNFASVASVCDIKDYGPILREAQSKGVLSEKTLKRLSAKVFRCVSAYDALVASYLSDRQDVSRTEVLPARMSLDFEKVRDLRYGENPHQAGALYRSLGTGEPPLALAKVLGGKELSFNNLLDMEWAWSVVSAFQESASCVVKHNSPCGIALNAKPQKAFENAFACDPLSSFGGIVGFNRKVDTLMAKSLLAAGFLECIVAPAFTEDALGLLRQKKNLRLVQGRRQGLSRYLDFKKLKGGLLLQEGDVKDVKNKDLKVVTRVKPKARQIKDMLFAFKLCRFVKSNAIVIVKDGCTLGIGTGQPSRVDSALHAFRKAGKRAQGAVLASDGFFPKPDSIELAAKHGIQAIIQPGGSIQDPQVIKACNEAQMAMVLTGLRHFTH